MWWIVATVALAKPMMDASSVKQVELNYSVSFNLDDRGDAACRYTGVCDCSATFKASAKRATVDGNRLTMRGSWVEEENTCHDSLSPWVDPKGKAFHTFRFSDDGTRLSEWLVHADVSKLDRLKEGMKKGQQYWIADMNALFDPMTGRVNYEERESIPVSFFQIQSHHQLDLRFAQ